VNFAIGAGLQPLLFGCHFDCREGVQNCIRCAVSFASRPLPTGLQSANPLLEGRLPCILVASNLRDEASSH
jgi:hypothetical protein